MLWSFRSGRKQGRSIAVPPPPPPAPRRWWRWCDPTWKKPFCTAFYIRSLEIHKKTYFQIGFDVKFDDLALSCKNMDTQSFYNELWLGHLNYIDYFYRSNKNGIGKWYKKHAILIFISSGNDRIRIVESDGNHAASITANVRRYHDVRILHIARETSPGKLHFQ